MAYTYEQLLAAVTQGCGGTPGLLVQGDPPARVKTHYQNLGGTAQIGVTFYIGWPEAEVQKNIARANEQAIDGKQAAETRAKTANPPVGTDPKAPEAKVIEETKAAAPKAPEPPTPKVLTSEALQTLTQGTREPTNTAPATLPTPAAIAAGVATAKSTAAPYHVSLLRRAAGFAVTLNNARAQVVGAMRNFRGRTGTPFSNDRGSDPPTYIEIAQMPADPKGSADLAQIKALGVKYNDFFITDTMETDAEKAEVSETFGAPHVFATGRYMRKVTISGMCRTSAVSPGLLEVSADDARSAYFLAAMTDQDKAKFIVPHTLGLRVLYDRALRASEQVARSLFSRLVVDGEVYCGWFTTLNIVRNGEQYGFAHFTMSMLVFARYHKDEDWAARLLEVGALPAKNAFDDSTASATLASMVGEMTIKLNAASIDVQQTVSEALSGALSFKTAVKLETSGVSQPVITQTLYNGSPLQGFSLKFGNNSSSMSTLNGSTTGIGSFDLIPAVDDFEAFLKGARAAGLASAGKQNMQITVDIKPALGGAAVQLKVNLTVVATQTPKISGLTVRLGASNEDLSSIVTEPPKDVFQTATTSALKLRFNLTSAGGSPLVLTPEMLAGTKMTVVHPDKQTDRTAEGPVAEATVGGVLGAVEPADKDAAAKPGAIKVSVPPTLVLLEAATGNCELAVTFDYAQLAAGVNLRTSSPFVSAKDIVAAFRYKLAIPGLNDCTTPRVSITAAYEKSWVSRLLMSIKTVVVEARSGSGGLRNGPSGDSRVISIEFNLHPGPEVAALVASNTVAVQQAVQSIVRASTFDGAQPASGFVLGFALFYSKFDTSELANATCVSVTAATATVTTQAFASVPSERKGTPKQLIMTVPQGIVPISMYNRPT